MNPFQSSTEACGSCGITPPILLFIHTTRYRATNRRLCTNCILKLNQGAFCPICFELFDDSPLPNLRLMCLRCPSIAHRSCVHSSTSTPDPAFLCPSCADPNFSYLNLHRRVVDYQSAKALVAAAQISARSLSQTAVAARLYAERRVMEAAMARKKATEALEYLADVVSRKHESSTEEEEEEEEEEDDDDDDDEEDDSGSPSSGCQSSE